jgi:hypothetical protein
MTQRKPTTELIRLLGSPFVSGAVSAPSDETLLEIYDQAFKDRIAPLILNKYRRPDWSSQLEERYTFVTAREDMTITVLSDLADTLNAFDPEGYVIFKSIKPYPAIPNDTDVLIFGNKRVYDATMEFLYSRGYIFHEWAPMQITVYDPRGVGKIGQGKKGGTYYLDIYQDISTDYVCYLDKKSLAPYTLRKQIKGKTVRLLRPEPELAIILFHNMFPERTFQLEHFFMPLYYLARPDFEMDIFTRFVGENRLSFAVRTNLSLIATLHQECFGVTPEKVMLLLQRWGWNKAEVGRFKAAGMETPYMFSPAAFWTTFLHKLRDGAFAKSLVVQSIHMLNPVFLLDVLKSLKRRLSERGVYHME